MTNVQSSPNCLNPNFGHLDLGIHWTLGFGHWGFNNHYQGMRWYQTAWGVALLGLSALVILAVAVFAVVTVKFWWQIKRGQGTFLQQEFYGGFDRDPKATGKAAETIDRNVLEDGDFPFLGNPLAPVRIVVFGDFRCPNTKAAWPILQRLVNTYGYKVKLIFRNFPVESTHPGANKLAEIGVCAYEQEKYMQAHNYLFTNQANLPTYLTALDLAALAKDIGLDLDKLNKCLSANSTLVKVSRDYADGFKYGAAGTPTFFINGQKVQGVVPWEVWEKFVKELK